MHRTIMIASLLLPTGLVAQDGDAVYAELVAAFEKETAKYHDPDAKITPLLPAKSPFHDKFLAAAKRNEGKDAALQFLGWVLQNAPRNRDAHGIAVKAIDAIAKQRAAKLEASEDRKRASKKLYTASRKAVRALKYGTTTNAGFAKTLLDAKVLALAAADGSVRQASARSVFKLERLQTGMVAPDIEGNDLDGVAFKLSDYRGKAVVIDFWGDW